MFENIWCSAKIPCGYGMHPNCDVAAICEAVQLEYARYLLSLGNRRAAEFYCTRAGEKGEQLLKDVNSAFGS